MINEFHALQRNGTCAVERLTSLRVKLLVQCQWHCSMCHQEGNSAASTMELTPEFTDTLKLFRDKLGFTEVHFTGGEPTLHPQLPQFVSLCADLGIKPKATSNGQVSETKLRELADAGLQELNVSMHTLDPAELAGIQMYPRTFEWASRNIEQQCLCLANAKGLVAQKVNTVVADKHLPSLAVHEFCQRHDIPWRAMNELSQPDISYASLKRLADTLHAVPVSATLIAGSSSCSVTLATPDGHSFKAKLIRPHKIDPMCSNCQLDMENKCFEYAYGPRLEAMQGSLFVRSCIHRHDTPHTLSVQKFFLSSVFREIKKTLDDVP